MKIRQRRLQSDESITRPCWSYKRVLEKHPARWYRRFRLASAVATDHAPACLLPLHRPTPALSRGTFVPTKLSICSVGSFNVSHDALLQ